MITISLYHFSYFFFRNDYRLRGGDERGHARLDHNCDVELHIVRCDVGRRWASAWSAPS